MEKTLRYLGIGAVAQLALAAVVYWPFGGDRAEAAVQPLLAFKSEQVDDIVISDKNASVHLAKVNGSWQLPEYQQLPAAAAKVEELVGKMTREHAGWPVATSADSAKRFAVADDQFERKLQFGAAGKTELVLLGSSPAFRKVHARRSGDQSVFAIDFNTVDAPVEAGQWLDKSLLALKGDISAIAAEDVKLSKGAMGWQLQGSDKVNQQAVEELLQQLRMLAIEEVAVPPATTTPAKTLTATVDGKVVTLQLRRDQEAVYINTSTWPQWFRVAEPMVAAVLGLSAAALQQTEVAPGPTAPPAG